MQSVASPLIDRLSLRGHLRVALDAAPLSCLRYRCSHQLQRHAMFGSKSQPRAPQYETLNKAAAPNFHTRERLDNGERGRVTCRLKSNALDIAMRVK